MTNPSISRLTTSLLLALSLGACDGTKEPADAPRCQAAATPVTCSEASIDKLSLRNVPSTGEIVEEGTTSGQFHTYVDARAGGSNPRESYTYARFSPQGLSRVDVDDVAALSSADWDIAFRRFVIRVNSGVSGPSCTTVARLPEGTSFDSVKAVDAAWEFLAENYFTDEDPEETCQVVSASPLGDPDTRLSTFWKYEACVAMTGNVFVARLADGKHVKLQVTSYYAPDQQQTCDSSGKIPMPSDAARIRVRWAYLP
ncbi:MAG: HmuY family protein [Cystobacter sp.]